MQFRLAWKDYIVEITYQIQKTGPWESRAASIGYK